jgi:hypothetical protein
MDATNTIAWIGVITGSIGTVTGVSALAWDFYKWKHSGPKLEIAVMPGMTPLNVPGVDANDRLVWVRITNTGQSKTTIQTLSFSFFETEPNKDFTKPTPAFQGVVANPVLYMGATANPVVEPGGEWSGFASQTPDIERMARDGFLYARVYHTMGGNKPLSGRVIIKDENLAPRRHEGHPVPSRNHH